MVTALFDAPEGRHFGGKTEGEKTRFGEVSRIYFAKSGFQKLDLARYKSDSSPNLGSRGHTAAGYRLLPNVLINPTCDVLQVFLGKGR